MALKKSENPKPSRASAPYIAIPRPWLVALIAVLIVPWLTVAAIWLKPMSLTRAGAVSNSSDRSTHTGKWGEMTLVPIVISPPIELVYTDWGFLRRPVWFFPGSNADSVAQMLQSAGVSADDAARLRFESRYEPQISGIVIAPDPAWVRSLNKETRGRIYHMLARSDMNVDQIQAFRYLGSSPDAWFGNLIPPSTRQIIEPLIYRDGDYMFFADIELVRSELGSESELRRLGKTLCRQPTVIARLSVGNVSNLDTMVEYWGRGGRRTEIRPLLESLVGNDAERYIDTIHLLPPFAQKHLYTYPKLSAADIDRPSVANCLWTSLNFFRPEPDERYLDTSIALRTLKEDYFIVEADFELGDIAAFLDEEGNIFHAAVYIADDLMFSKNGISAMAPWTLMKLDDVKGYYRGRSENPRLIFHRRKDL